MGIDLRKLKVRQEEGKDLVEDVVREVFETDSVAEGAKAPTPTPTPTPLEEGNRATKQEEEVFPDGGRYTGEMLYQGEPVRVGDRVDTDGNTWVRTKEGKDVQVKAKELEALPEGFVAKEAEENRKEADEGRQPEEPKRKGGFWNTYVGDMLERMGAGAADFGGGVYSLLDKVANWTNPLYWIKTRPYNQQHPENPIKGWFQQQAESSYQYANTLRQRSDRYDGKGFSDLWKEGDYWGVAGEVFLTASESLPQSVAAMMGGPAGLAVTGASAGAQKYDQLDREPETKDLPEYSKLLNAVSTGTFEALTERLGDIPIGKELAKVYRRLGPVKAEKAVENGISGWMQRQFKRYGLLFAPVAEGTEEVASQVAENMTDYFTGVTNEFRPMDGTWDSFVYGAAGGGQFALAGVPGLAKREYDRFRARKDYREAEKRVKEVFPDDEEEEAGTFTRTLTYLSPAEQEATLSRMAQGGYSEEQINRLEDFTAAANRYKVYKSKEAVEQERARIQEDFVEKTLREFDIGVQEIVNEDGMIQSVALNGNEGEKVYIVKGHIAVQEVGNGYTVDVAQCSPELYYRDKNGDMQVTSPQGITVEYLGDAREIRRHYEEELRKGLSGLALGNAAGPLREVESDVLAEGRRRPEGTGKESRPETEESGTKPEAGSEARETTAGREIRNGDRVRYRDEAGQEAEGVVADAYSVSEFVFLEDGTAIERNEVVKRLEEEESKPGEAVEPTEAPEVTEPTKATELPKAPKVTEPAGPIGPVAPGGRETGGPVEREAQPGGRTEESGGGVSASPTPIVVAERRKEGTSPLPESVEAGKPIAGQGRETGEFSEGTAEERTAEEGRDAGEVNNEEVNNEEAEVIQDGLKRRFYELKGEYPDGILLFRKDGDYVAILKDAEQLGRLLGVEAERNERQEAYWKVEGENLAAVMNGIIRSGERVLLVEEEEEGRKPGKARKASKRPGLRYAERDKALGEFVSLRDELLRGIGTGRYRFTWNDQEGRRGVVKELGLAGSERERRRRLWMFDNSGYSVDGLAHYLSENPDSRGYGRSTEDIRNEIIDVLNAYDSPSEMMEAAEKMRLSGEESRAAFLAGLSEEELDWLSELEALKAEVERELEGRIPVELEEAFLRRGVTEKELESLGNIDDFIRFVNGKGVENESERRETNESGEPARGGEKVAGVGRKGGSAPAVGGEVVRREKPGRSAENPLSTEGPGKVVLSAEEGKVAEEVTGKAEEEIERVTRQLAAKRQELSAKKREIGKVYGKEGQLSLFEEEEAKGREKLFEVEPDFSEEHLREVVRPLQEEVKQLEGELERLKAGKEKKVKEAVEAYRRQGRLFEEGTEKVTKEVTREEIEGCEADEQLKDMALDYLAGERNAANEVAYLSIKNRIEDDRNRSRGIERDRGAGGTESAQPEVFQAELPGTGEGGGSVVRGDDGSGGASSGKVQSAGSGQGNGRTDDHPPLYRGGADEFTAGDGERSAGEVSGASPGADGPVDTGGRRGGSGVVKPGKERATSSGGEAGDPGRAKAADEGRETAGRNRKANLDAELSAALGELDEAIEEFKRAGKNLNLSFVGLTNEQIEAIGNIIAKGAKVGHVLLRKGVYTLEEWTHALKELIGEKLRRIGLTEADVDELVGDMWKTKVRDEKGERKRICDLAAEYEALSHPPAAQEAHNSFAEMCRRNFERQEAAEAIGVKTGDAKNIRETLPMLLPEQQEDVVKAERRFAMEKGKGILFTNGTGTGKTFTGLGIVKRFVKQGRKDVLIVVPSSEKVRDWAEDGEKLLLRITPLRDTKDAGQGVVVTTYANFRMNEELKKRTFDLVVYDECHRLMESGDAQRSATTETHFRITNRDAVYAELRLSALDADYRKWRDIEEEQARELNRAAKKSFSTEAEKAKYKAYLKKLEQDCRACKKAWEKKKPLILAKAKEAAERTKVVFLSATPFKGIFNLEYAEGYLFDYPKQEYKGYNVATGSNRFYLENFGAQLEMKYGRLQKRPKQNAEAVAMQEIEFQQKMSQAGAMSGRSIESNRDYSREFVKPHDKEFDCELFNAAFSAIFDYTEEAAYKGLRAAARKVFFDYHYSTRLMEVLKANLFIPRIRRHLELGRKVVVFHRRKQANVNPPYSLILNLTKAEALETMQEEGAKEEDLKEAEQALAECEGFREEFGELLMYEQTLDYSPAIDQLRAAFGERLRLFNGDVSKEEKSRAVAEFNSDESGVDVLVVQEESGKEGISLHDRTGKHQRVLMSLSAPNSSITALQIEGRIFRLGQETDAIFEYPVLGLDSEMILFSQTINRKLSTTENLALGDEARDLLRSFADGIQNWTEEEPREGQGTGGKETDRREKDVRTPFQKAVLVYATNQKNRKKREHREGVDYFATPEPLGAKMVEWSGLRPEEQLLEPSAGDGAIARWVPLWAGATVIEPSVRLYARLGGNVQNPDSKILNELFENHDLQNKYDVVVMNPPFGTGGATAMAHVAKAFRHLRNGGRLVAIVPQNKRLGKWLEDFLYGEDSKGRLLNPEARLAGEVILPRCTFEQAGTGVWCRVVVIDKVGEGVIFHGNPPRQTDLRYCEKVDELFEKLEDLEMPPRAELSPEALEQMKQEKAGQEPKEEKELLSEIMQTKHTKTGADLFYVKLNYQVEAEDYRRLKELAKAHEGYYSRFLKGFTFNKPEDAEAWRQEVNAAYEEEEAGTAAEADVRYRMERNLTAEGVFFSNAYRAVESVRQEKATPGQWLGMLEKAGGLKAGEDEWLGLRDWLKQSQEKVLTKKEVLRFIRSNQIQVGEIRLHQRVRDYTKADVVQAEVVEERNKVYVKFYDGESFFADIKEGKSLEKMVEDIVRAANFVQTGKEINPIRFRYTTKGMRDYWESVLFVPGIRRWNHEDEIHFGEVGQGRAVAWCRFGETVDAEGKRVLVMDEVQSQRHQEGRKQGYDKDVDREFEGDPLFPFAKRLCQLEDGYLEGDLDVNDYLKKREQLFQETEAAGFSRGQLWELDTQYVKKRELGGYVPDAPFSKNWAELVFKRMLRYAAEKGFDRLAWTKGKQQAERYDLSEEIKAIEWEREGDRWYRLYSIQWNEGLGTEERYLITPGVHESDLARWIGERAANLMKRSKKKEGRLEGEDLRSPASGLKAFYDGMLVNFANQYGKKWGVQVEEVRLPKVEEAGRHMWSVRVTEGMRESVMGGQALFRARAAEEGRQRREQVVKEIERLRQGLGVAVKTVESRADLPEALRRGLKSEMRYPGLYRGKTGEVWLVVDEIEDERDAQRTILHEVVGHKGIRGLFGERMADFAEAVLKSMDEEERAAWLKRYGGDRQLAAEEYVAGFAEGYSEPSAWGKVKAIVREWLRRVGIDLKLTDGDLQYLLWRGTNRLRREDSAAETIEKAGKDEVMFREAEQERRVNLEEVAEVDVENEEKTKLHNEIVSRRFRFMEAYQDRLLSVKRLQELIERKIGKRLPVYMDAYRFENTLASRNTYEMEHFRQNELKRMTQGIAGLEARGLRLREVENYVMAKHGLERNAYMRKKYLEEWYRPLSANLEEQRDRMQEEEYEREVELLNEVKALKEKELEEKDFSGLDKIEAELKRRGLELEEFVKGTEERYGEEVAELWKGIRECTGFALRKWFESGMIDRKRLERIQGMYKYYVPLRGFDETVARDVYEYFEERPSPFNSPLRKAKGRRSRADSPFAYIVSMAESSIVGGNKNLMKLHFFRLAQKYPSQLLSVSKVWYKQTGLDEKGKPVYQAVLPVYDEDAEMYRQHVEEFKREMEELEAKKEAYRSRYRLQVGYRLLGEEQEEHTVWVRLNGEAYAVLVHGDPRPAQAIEGLNDETRIENRVLNGIRWMNRQLAANFTTRNPAFIASNLVRDLVFSTTVLSVKEGRAYRNRFLRNIRAASGAIRRYLKGEAKEGNRMDGLFREFIQNGGETGYTALYNLERFKRMVEKAVEETKEKRVIRAGRKVMDYFASGNRWAEDLARFAVYVTSREAGRPVLECVSDAKEVTVNFNRKGSGAWGAEVLKSLYIFFNAAVQSLANLYQVSLKEPKRTARMLGGYALGGLLVPVLLRALGGEEAEEEYLNLPDYVRKNNLCLYLGGKRGFVTIPLPIELRAFWGLGDAAYRYMRGDVGGITASGEVISGVLDVLPLNPVGGSMPFVPDALKPLGQALYANEDFVGRPIAKVTPYNRYEPEYQRVYKGTGAFFRKSAQVCNRLSGGDYATRGKVDEVGETVAEVTGMRVNPTNPAVAEHLLESYLGGMYKTVMQGLTSVEGLYRWGKTGRREELETWQVPLLNRFYSEGGEFNRRRRIDERFYRVLEELRETEHRLRKYRAAVENGEMSAEKAMEKYAKVAESGAYERAEVIGYYAGEVEKLMQQLREDAVLSEAEREELAEEVYLLKERLLEELRAGRKKR